MPDTQEEAEENQYVNVVNNSKKKKQVGSFRALCDANGYEIQVSICATHAFLIN